MTSGKPEQEPVTVTDKRRIDPETFEVRDAAESSEGTGAPAEGTVENEGTVNEGVVENEDGEEVRVEEIVSTEAELAERTADLQRVSAEYTNYRRRAEREKAAIGAGSIIASAPNMQSTMRKPVRPRAAQAAGGAVQGVEQHGVRDGEARRERLGGGRRQLREGVLRPRHEAPLGRLALDDLGEQLIHGDDLGLGPHPPRAAPEQRKRERHDGLRGGQLVGLSGGRPHGAGHQGTDRDHPQDPRARRRQRIRRAKKNMEWEQKRALENAEAAKPKTPAKTAT